MDDGISLATIATSIKPPFLPLKTQHPFSPSSSSISSQSPNREPKNMMNMKKQLHLGLQHSSSVLLMIMITLLFTTTLAQSPATAPAPSVPIPPSPPLPVAASPGPASSGPTNITAILEKAGRFNIFIRLLKSTGLADQINSEINNTNQAITLFAPPDNAFSGLPSGTSLNSFTGEQQIKLVQFHLLSTYVSPIQFQTLSNPVRTQAGSSRDDQFPLNLITSGTNVTMTTGIVNATVVNKIYTDGQLAVYEVDKVLLPRQFYVTPSPAPAPALALPKPNKSQPLSAVPSIPTVVPSNAVSISRYIGVSIAVAVVAVIAI